MSSATLVRAAAVARALTEGELLLLAWRAQGVTAREVAAWTGVSFHAARKRIERVVRRARRSLA